MAFNGWANYRTWRAALTLSNSPILYHWACRIIRDNILNEHAVEEFKADFELRFTGKEPINWLEIVQSFREDDPLWNLCTDNEEERKTAANIIADRTMFSVLWLYTNLPEGLCFCDDWDLFETWIKGYVQS